MLHDAMKSLRWVAIAALCACSDGTAPPRVSEVQQTLERIRAEYGLPGMAGAVLSADGITDRGIVGVRKAGATDLLTPADRFHLGSLMKAMTATTIATVVEEGRLAWSSTPEMVFPELVTDMHPALRGVTLAQLLRHRAAIQSFTSPDEFTELPLFTGSPLEQRLAFTAWLLEHGFEGSVGTFNYSNADYSIAAAMAERVTGVPFETLMAQRLLAPLSISGSAGWPAALTPSAPWGHTGGAGVYTPEDPFGAYQLPSIIAPAGDMSMTLDHYAEFARLHLHALRGHPQLLDAATFETLHTAEGDYAMGWLRGTLGNSDVAAHQGSAGTFVAVVLIQPTRNLAVVVFVNAGGLDATGAAEIAALELAGYLFSPIATLRTVGVP
jgi:D-alanyl-D-alanine carboxypeptidase